MLILWYQVLFLTQPSLLLSVSSSLFSLLFFCWAGIEASEVEVGSGGLWSWWKGLDVGTLSEQLMIWEWVRIWAWVRGNLGFGKELGGGWCFGWKQRWVL